MSLRAKSGSVQDHLRRFRMLYKKKGCAEKEEFLDFLESLSQHDLYFRDRNIKVDRDLVDYVTVVFLDIFGENNET